MAPPEVTFQTTPNPAAVKCLVGATISDRPRSYFNAAAAAGDRLAEALFAIPGVTNVLIQDTWLTVCKAEGVEWGPVKTGVRRAVADELARAGRAGS